MEKKHFGETIWDKVHVAHPTSIKRIALMSTVQPDHDWAQNNLQKTDTETIFRNHVDFDEWKKFLPTKEQQDLDALVTALPLREEAFGT